MDDTTTTARTEGAPETSKPIEAGEWTRLTPRSLVRLLTRLTIGSWLLVLGAIGTGTAASFAAGLAFGTGQFSSDLYKTLGVSPNPAQERMARERRERFRDAYASRIADDNVLRPLVRGILTDRPDGLPDEASVRASLLAQLALSGGTARFLAGETSHGLEIRVEEDRLAFEWPETPSVVPKILADRRIPYDKVTLRRINADLNRIGLARISGDSVIVRLDDGLQLVVSVD